jgi:hypothetical protein
VKIGKSASKTLALLILAYVGYATNKSSVLLWHRRFKEGRDDVGDDPRSGQPSKCGQSTNLAALRQKIRRETNSGIIEYENLFKGKDPISPDKWIFHHDNDPANDAL